LSEEKSYIVPDIRVPFDHMGMMHTVHDQKVYVNNETGDIVNSAPGIWKDTNYTMEMLVPTMEYNFAFEDILLFDQFCNNGNASTYVTFVSDVNGAKYYMSIKEFGKIINEMISGVIGGIFSFKKNGNYYTLYKIEDMED
jgi:hypothetical protein